ncbi:hypothetical protein [Mycolicibacterium sp. HK-90]|uniref:hypothetical protein n=1 Tax=Mycolicibacterium sp. HK-90 TaxID=3056937 RepID=UPI00265A4F92|nr:hypothetical protein [Mycolicibacterium sp. HK-90]WKG00840.1 hypothetical protein QU592_16070 [Mycolicibacterium sp. HK-90]
MRWVITLIARATATGMTVAAGILSATVLVAATPASATPVEEAGAADAPAAVGPFIQNDPGCDMFGWRHPLCAGGAFDTPPDDGIPGDNAAEGGIPAPAMVPNVDGSLSPPGTPGAI